MEEEREADDITYGPATPKAVELIENFCSMHLGVNLRKVRLSGFDARSDLWQASSSCGYTGT